jgi:hypothetical protein
LELSLPILSPLCEFGPSKNDSNGCPIAPDIICKAAEVNAPAKPLFQQGESSQQPVSQSVTPPTRTSPTGPTSASTAASQQSSSAAPQQQQSQSPHTAAAQSQTSPTSPQPQQASSATPQQPAKAAQPVIVNPQQAPSKAESAADVLRQISGSFNETTEAEEPAKNFTFEDMLGTDFLHVMNISQMPEAEAFRKTKGAPENASGKFHRCKIQADCYNFREPAEWCKPKKNVQWKGKSCFCATDTMTPACIVERTDGEKLQWTFCSSFLDLKCS